MDVPFRAEHSHSFCFSALPPAESLHPLHKGASLMKSERDSDICEYSDRNGGQS